MTCQLYPTPDPVARLHHLPDAPPLDMVKDCIDWQQRDVLIMGRSVPQPRLVCWYGPIPYSYSGSTMPAREMPELLNLLRFEVQRISGESFNSVMCNLYRDGRDSVSWHSDDESIFDPDHVVASLSFGATRRFRMKPTGQAARCMVPRYYELAHGDLLVMGAGVQRSWLHCVPKTKRAVGARVNLTFRRTR